MKINKWLIAGLMSLAVSNVCSAQSMSSIYESRCANCHGVTANGVPLLTEKDGVKPDVADAQGIASEEKTNIFGPPLNHLSKSELVAKLMDLRNIGFDAKSYHSVMRKNLEKIEAREGKVDDEQMAEYIFTTFGGGAK